MKAMLNTRQQRFCELLVSGESQTDAYLKAGYKVTREVARRNAAESLTKPDVKARVAELRAVETSALMLTRNRKREMLCKIAEDLSLPVEARIRAMAEDSKMAGHYEPEHHVVDASNNALQSIKERAMKVASALSAVPRGQPATL